MIDPLEFDDYGDNQIETPYDAAGAFLNFTVEGGNVLVLLSADEGADSEVRLSAAGVRQLYNFLGRHLG